MVTEKLDQALVRSFPIFQNTPAADLGTMLNHASPRQVSPGSSVFTQGAMADSFYVLLFGRLKVVQTTRDGHQVIVRHVNPGDLFGIAQALARPDYPATAIALTDSRMLFWNAALWSSFLSLSPAFAQNALHAVGQRLQEAHTRIQELTTEEVERRIAHAVLHLAERSGRPAEGGVLLDFPITRQDIAEMTGTTLHTASRIMAAWDTQGLIDSKRKNLLVRDTFALTAIAERVAE
ncbi:CarD family transcriptional regulator [Elstera cyanobacteriorum]|uniref:Crp/Fnr family transcriptional regulator n=1 Tax=Elstera cyanobacteriorum TaxID=2022747 RepID=A0A255XSQ1_9PROT|nr:Crp/Fnr family transcriptional regulator [Elstera cyanobacteriorum]OYQ19280.1 Crp/Fnr family transcriptional regulator [Elstera cyanobacteriorum]GFZ90271.1 CarD family transcriptional regulator [Elstera cyanobacteriorum]